MSGHYNESTLFSVRYEVDLYMECRLILSFKRVKERKRADTSQENVWT